MSSNILLSLALWTLLTGLFTLVAGFIARKRQLTPGFWLCTLIASSVVLLPIPDVLLRHAKYAGDTDFGVFEPAVWVADNITTPLQQPWAVSWSLLILLLMVLVSVLRLIRLARHYQAVLQVAEQGTHYPKALNTKVINGDIDCVILPAQAPPTGAFVIGLRRPRIVLPDSFLKLSSHQQQMILAHELNHIRFYDHWWLVAWHVVSAAAWFNPFLVKLSAHFTQAVEMRCDAATIAQGRFCRNAYARALLASLRQSLNAAPAPDTAAMQLSFSGYGTGLAAYKQRIRAILGSGPASLNWQRQWPVFLAALVLVLFARSAYTRALTSGPGQWLMPVAEPAISSSFGHVASIRHNQVHQGVDFKGPVGTAIYASAAGRIIIADSTSLNASYGKVVVVQHSDGWQTLYAHLDHIEVQKGDRVSQGQIIGTMGATGKVTGSHLHFELVEDGQRRDPMAYLGDAAMSEGK
jgi:murein DD-endopeptidase MepM/ murein hydrolase activator NlpD